MHHHTLTRLLRSPCNQLAIATIQHVHPLCTTNSNKPFCMAFIHAIDTCRTLIYSTKTQWLQDNAYAGPPPCARGAPYHARSGKGCREACNGSLSFVYMYAQELNPHKHVGQRRSSQCRSSSCSHGHHP